MNDADLEPRKLPQQERSRLLVDDILEAAARVFESHGYARATTNRIAATAGVSIGSVYQYFPNKDAILVALTQRHIDEGAAILAPLLADLSPETPLDASLARIVHAMVELHRRRPALHRVLVEESPRPPELRARFDSLFDDATHLVARHLDAHPDVTVANSSIAAMLVVEVIEAVTHQLVIDDRRRDAEPDAIATETVRMLTAYLSAPPVAAGRRG